MGIGTSLGAYFETSLDHHAGNETLDQNEYSDEGITHDDTPIPVSDIKTASPLVTITDEDIDKGMSLGMSFSGGGLTTTEGKVLQMRKKAANDNVPDLVNPNLTPVEQLARKLAETDNGKGSWDRIGGGGQEHYWRDAEKALKQQRPSDYDGIQRYNTNEPNMIGSKDIDNDILSSWGEQVAKHQRGNEIFAEQDKLMEILKTRKWNDLENHRYNKLNKEHEQLFPPGVYNPD